MPVLCGYIDLNTRICGSTRIYAGIVATLTLSKKKKMKKEKEKGTRDTCYL